MAELYSTMPITLFSERVKRYVVFSKLSDDPRVWVKSRFQKYSSTQFIFFKFHLDIRDM